MAARIPKPELTTEFGVLGHQPDLMAAFSRLYGHLWSRGVLDHPTKEAVRLRNARVTDCRFCKNVRFAVAREQGLTEELVAQIDDEYETSSLSERQKIALHFTHVFLAEPKRVDDKMRAELLEHFTPSEIVELAASVALFMGFSKIVVALGTAPEAMPTTILPTPQ